MTDARILGGRSPAQWVEALAARGLRISERTLRARANAAGACLKLGSQMIILPEHIDQLFEAPECRSRSTPATASSGFEADLLMANVTDEQVFAHLTRKSPPPSAPRSNSRRGNVLSLAAPRQSRKTS